MELRLYREALSRTGGRCGSCSEAVYVLILGPPAQGGGPSKCQGRGCLHPKDQIHSLSIEVKSYWKKTTPVCVDIAYGAFQIQGRRIRALRRRQHGPRKSRKVGQILFGGSGRVSTASGTAAPLIFNCT